MYIHPKSASHGITLTKGVATIWASPTYNAEYFEQANARIYRGGQTQTTETILISADGTAEQDVYTALYDKRVNMHNLLEVLK
jgi:SNF2 family DNA or RNA helicase